MAQLDARAALFTALYDERTRRPYHNIGMIDSRAWDPNWEHRRAYRTLVNITENILGYGHAWSNARTLASNTSYWWGRGSLPADVVSKLSNFSPQEVHRRIVFFVNRLTGGGDMNTLARAISIFGQARGRSIDQFTFILKWFRRRATRALNAIANPVAAVGEQIDSPDDAPFRPNAYGRIGEQGYSDALIMV